MDPKPRPNHEIYLETLRRMTPEQRLLKAFELTEQSHELLRAGVRSRFPDAGPEEQQRMGSQKQTEDAFGVNEFQGDRLDGRYLDDWAEFLGVSGALAAITERASAER